MAELQISFQMPVLADLKIQQYIEIIELTGK